MEMFLNPKEIQTLTGRKRKALQIAWLRKEAIPFRVTALGYPIVTRSAIENTKPQPAEQPHQRWTPRVIS